MSVFAIVAVVAVVAGVTYAEFFDTETSNDNAFASGTLDLNVDGGNTNVVKFNVTNMHVGSQRVGTWRLRNVGTVNGFVDLENIVVTSQENGCNDPESEALDSTYLNPSIN